MGVKKSRVSPDVAVDYRGEKVVVHFNAHRVDGFSASEYYTEYGRGIFLREALHDDHPHSWASINNWLMSLEGQQKVFYCMIQGDYNG